jgi:hypothetical protein
MAQFQYKGMYQCGNGVVPSLIFPRINVVNMTDGVSRLNNFRDNRRHVNLPGGIAMLDLDR